MTPASATRDTGWLRRRSLKFRLVACFTLVTCLAMAALVPVAYALIGRRLQAEVVRQLEIDANLIEAHLEEDDGGGIRWRKNSPASPDRPGYAESWFDVWEDGRLRLSHRPPDGVEVLLPPRPVPDHQSLSYGLELEATGIPARVVQRSARVGDRALTLRVFRNESGLRATLREILASFALGVPLAVALAAIAGYLLAGRALAPLEAMASQARLISFESLGHRLPNPNPEDELGQLATVFNETLGRLEVSYESLKRFTADASHELRTPITALRSVGEIALRSPCEVEGLRETIGSMLEEAQRLHHLIDSLLMFARVESGRMQLAMEPVSLTSLVADVCDTLEILAMDKGQTLVRHLDPRWIVQADRHHLIRTVMNLLDNAIRYSPVGSIVTVEVAGTGSQATVTVGDQGPGIAPEHQERVFERFYRIDAARSREDGGTGLGLALAKLAVERMGGSIDIISEPGDGSRFRITLPAKCS